MSFADQKEGDARVSENPTDEFHDPRGPLHRIAVARRQQGLSLRTVAHRMQTTVAELRSQEVGETDLPLSALYRWCQVLQVPIEELLVEPSDSFSKPVFQRAQMIHILKTATSILDSSRSVEVQRLANTLLEQLTEVMPELKEIRTRQPAPDRSSSKRLGRVADHPLPETLFSENV